MKRIADYTFLELLGDGNHGSFYLARTPRRLGSDHAFCAVKVLAHQASEAAFKRMANELSIFASVGSPHLVRLLDAGHQNGNLYYATAFHEQGSLSSARHDQKEPEFFIRAVADAARGAHALHGVGVAHRDIKPSNVLVADGAAVLSDLGLAQLLSRGATLTGVGPIGTLGFMEPGLARGEQASRASDIWSLGATLLAVLTGRGPFPNLPSINLLEALNHVLREQPQVAEDLDPRVRDVVVACLDLDRSSRPDTALALAEALEEGIEHG